jgi:hypothetical protein
MKTLAIKSLGVVGLLFTVAYFAVWPPLTEKVSDSSRYGAMNQFGSPEIKAKESTLYNSMLLRFDDVMAQRAKERLREARLFGLQIFIISIILLLWARDLKAAETE